jgi:cupin fold WbuC family metalloprotein
MPEVIKNSENLFFVTNELVNQVKDEARKSSRLMARILMHFNHENPVQEMLIAMGRGCVVKPNRSVGRSESLLVVEGELLLVLFDENGNVVQRVEMAPPGKGKVFLYRFSSTPWHTMIPLSQEVVVHETLEGPFVQSTDPLPQWIPEETVELEEFLRLATES